MIDWSQAFDRQSHQLGIRSFLRNGVRSSLIPYLMDYFRDRKMRVKWNTKMSSFRQLPGGGPQGGIMGILEYLSQSNNNVDFLALDENFKFIDDLSILEMHNLVMTGISSYNFKNHVASDIGVHGQYLPTENAQSQHYLDNISKWTEDRQMVLNATKTKYMVVPGRILP